MNQKCIVHNKTQLLAAVGCAFDYFGTTEIVLNGKTHIKLKPDQKFDEINNDYVYGLFLKARKKYHKGLKKVLANIRKTPAECFR